MKNIKNYKHFINENIKHKDVNEQIDEILDNLSKKGELSKSEKEFMDEASNQTIKEITVPSPSGNFWADMSNPHNISTLWLGKDGVWKQLKSVEDEEYDKIYNIKDSDERWERKKEIEQKKILKKLPEIKDILLRLAKSHINNSNKGISMNIKKLEELANKIEDNDLRYSINRKIDYASKSIYSLDNQFGYILPELVFDEDKEEYIIKK